MSEQGAELDVADKHPAFNVGSVLDWLLARGNDLAEDDQRWLYDRLEAAHDALIPLNDHPTLEHLLPEEARKLCGALHPKTPHDEENPHASRPLYCPLGPGHEGKHEVSLPSKADGSEHLLIKWE